MLLKYLRKLFLLTLLFSGAVCAEKVVLQLKWEHEFQFAGYYAAKWQRYYHEAGSDVEIKPVSRSDGSILMLIEEIKNGNAHFAVGALDILIGS